MIRLIIYLTSLLLVSSCSKVSDRLIYPQTLERFNFEKDFRKQERDISAYHETANKTKQKFEEIVFQEVRQTKTIAPVQEDEFDLENLKISEEQVLINADRAPLFDFILYVFGEVLKVPFIIEEDLRNLTIPITLRTPEPIPAKDALKMIISLLEKNNIKVSSKWGALYIYKPKILPSDPPRSISIGTEITDTSAKLLHIIPLKYIKASDIIPIITETYKGVVNIKPFAKDNSIIITGSGFHIKNIIEAIKKIDTPYLENKHIMMINLTYWRAEDFIRQLSEILQSLGIPIAKSLYEPGIFLVPVKHLNSIVAVLPDENAKKILIELAKRLDVPESAGTEEKLFIYYPLYTRASELVEAVKRLYTAQLSSSPFGTHSLSVSPTSQPQTSKPLEPKTSSPLSSPTQEKPASSISFSTESLKISSDDKRNIVMVISSPSTYKLLLELFKALDKPPRQVLIETVIAEVTLKDDLKYGVEWYIRNKMRDGIYTIHMQTLGQLGFSTLGGLIYQFVADAEKFKLLLNLFAQRNLINILSTPRLLVLDNEEATINVGMEVPIVTGEQTTSSVSTTTGVGIVRTFQYRTTGITLRVRPTINTEGLLTLNITQEVSQAQTNTISAIESPVILLRKINTSITAPSGHTIVLGGLIEERKISSEVKVPLIGDIPLLGRLFKNKTEDVTKTELIIMLTPKILSTTDELLKITEDLKRVFFQK
ncbi:MAG: type II secretion system secretin GspD [Candidatus Aenigmatarchaeota archaeon]